MIEKHVLIARHPETEANVTGRWVGRGNAPFTTLGNVQIELIAAEIRRFGADAVWSSPLERAHIPAARGAELLGVAHTVDERLSELDFGAAEGLTFAEAAERGIEFDFKSEDAPVAPDGESRRDIYLRTVDVLAEAMEASDRLAIVTHGGVFRSAIVALLDLPLDAIWKFHIRNSEIGHVRIVDGHGILERFDLADS